MTLIFYFTIALILGWAVYALYVQIASRKMKGQSAEALTGLFPELRQDDLPRLVFCFASSCAPCNAMKPDVEQLGRETGRVFSLDLTERPDIARQLGIRAVPTTLVVQDRIIRDSLPGRRSKQQLQKLLQERS